MTELVPGAVMAGYRIEAVAGRGGMGVVYLATQLALQRRVALKVIAPEFAGDPDFRARFKRESLLAASIEHPNVISIHDAREEGGLLFLVMAYVDGTDLREMIARERRIEPHRAARIVALVGSALDAAHAAGLVHRDVKPANVLLSSRHGEEQVYLTDFGLTKQASSQSGVTKTGMFVGTVDYVAPEQLRGGPVDGRTDVYALGCVLYQALTGTVPYPRDNELAKLFAHGSVPPPLVSAVAPDLNPAFDAVVAKAMAKDPDHRYLSAGDLGRAAVAAAQGHVLTRTERSVAVGQAAPTTPPTAVSAPPPAPAPTPVAPLGPLPTEAGAPLPSYAGAVTALAPHDSPRRRPTALLFAGAAALLVAVAVVLAIVVLGGSAAKKPTDPLVYGDQQRAAAEKFAASRYPGPGQTMTGTSCGGGPGGTNVGDTMFCTVPVDLGDGETTWQAQMTLHVTKEFPYEFALSSPRDCKLDDQNGKTRPCT